MPNNYDAYDPAHGSPRVMSKDGTPIREIVAEWLRANHYDGLCNPWADCGCGLDDLMPCDHPHDMNCVCAYEIPENDGSRYFCTSNSDQDEPSDTLEQVARDMCMLIEKIERKYPLLFNPNYKSGGQLIYSKWSEEYRDRLKELGVIVDEMAEDGSTRESCWKNIFAACH